MTKTTKPSAVDPDLVRQLADLLDETGLSEIEFGTEDWHIRVGKNSGPMAQSYALPASQPAGGASAGSLGAAEDDIANHPGALKSPMVGVAYTQSDPETPAYIAVGDTVVAGDTVLLIEAMKVFNPIQAHKAGKVTRILISNGTPVEFGEPLIIIE